MIPNLFVFQLELSSDLIVKPILYLTGTLIADRRCKKLHLLNLVCYRQIEESAIFFPASNS